MSSPFGGKYRKYASSPMDTFWIHQDATTLSIPRFLLEPNLRAEKELMEHGRTEGAQAGTRPGVARPPAPNKAPGPLGPFEPALLVQVQNLEWGLPTGRG